MMLGYPYKFSWKSQDSSKAMVQPQGEVQATPLLQIRTRGHRTSHTPQLISCC